MSTVTDELLLRIAVVGGAVAASEVAYFDDRIAAAGATVEKTSPKFAGLSRVFGSFGAIAAGFSLVAAVKQFSNFQRQMEMLHTQTGATQQEVGRATKAILGMAVSVGTGPNSLAQSLYHIESTQVRGKRAYDEMRVAAEGAKIGNANLVDVTNALNAVVVGKLLPGTNAFDKAMGQLNATVGSGDMYMQDLASAYSTGILKSLGQVGLKLVDVNAAMATLGDNNIRGTQAANRLRMGLLQVVKPTNAAANELHALGMSTYQLAEDYYKPRGLYVMLQDMHDHLDGLSKVRQNDVLMTLFGRGRMSAGVLTLYDEMSRLSSKYDAINKGANNFNQAWEATKQTLAFTIDQLKTLGEVVLIKVGKGLSDAVKWFRQMGPYAKTIRDIAIAFGIVYGAIKVASGAAIIFNAIADANPWVLALMAITALVVALIDHFGGLKRVVNAVVTFVTHRFEDVEATMLRVINSVVKFINFFIKGWDKIANISIFGYKPFGNLHIGQLAQVGTPGGIVKTGNDEYVPAYKFGTPGNVNVPLDPFTPNVGNQRVQTPAGADMAPGYAPKYVIVEIDGKQFAKAMVKQGAQAQARRGVGGPTLSDTGN